MTKKMWATLVLLVVGLISFGQVSQISAKPKTNVMRIGYASKGDPQDMNAHNFMEKLKGRVGNRINVELYPASQLGSNEIMNQQVQQGNLQGTIVPPAFLGGRHDLLTILDLPYFIETDLLSTAELLNGPIGQKLTEGLEKKGMVNIRFFPQGERILFTNFEVDNIDSFRGKKIRVMMSEVLINTYNAWGASGIPMNVPELYTALQQGTLDGVDTTAPFAYTWKYHEVTKYLVMVPRISIPAMFLVSKIWLEKLPKDLRQAIYDAAADDKEQQKITEKFNNDSFVEMEKEGIKIVYPSDNLLKELRERSKVVHKKFLSMYPAAKPIYDEIITKMSQK